MSIAEIEQNPRDHENRALTVVTVEKSDRAAESVSVRSSAWSLDNILWLVFGLFAPLVGMSAMLWLESLRLWEQAHMQFFPLACLAAAWFLYSGGRMQLATGLRMWLATFSILLFIAMGLVGTYWFRPWVVHVAAVGLVTAWALVAYAETTWTRIFAIAMLLVITVPLPLGRDQALVSELQGYSSWACNGILDGLSIPNLQQGNIIQIESKRLFVEEACSGVDSLYALVAVAIALNVIHRRPALAAFATCITVPFWAFVGNLLRLITIALGLQYWSVDLSSGTQHTILGFVVFSIAVACLVATEISFSALLAPFAEEDFMTSTGWFMRTFQMLARLPARSNLQTQLVHDFVPMEHEQSFVESNEQRTQVAAVQPTPAPNQHTRSSNHLTPTIAVSVFSVACVLFGSYAWYVIGGELDVLAKPVELSAEEAIQFPNQKNLPESFGPYQQSGYTETTRSVSDSFGHYSHVWRYATNRDAVLLSLDFPFRGWHPLHQCYVSSGNQLIESRFINLAEYGGGDWDVQEFSMRNDFGNVSYVWFGFFGSDGNPVRSPSVLASRLNQNIFARQSAAALVDNPMSFQVQLLVESGTELGPDELDANRRIFAAGLNRLRDQSLPALKSIE